MTMCSVFFHYLLRVLGFLIFVAGAALFLKLLSAHGYLPAQAALLPAPAQYKPPPPPPSVRGTDISTSAVKRSIGFTIGFHNHREGPYLVLLLVESAY